MESLQQCRALEAFCRQHARMEGEDPGFWLAEAERWQLASRARLFSQLFDEQVNGRRTPGASGPSLPL